MPKYLCVLIIVIASCKSTPKNSELLSTWNQETTIPNKEDAVRLRKQLDHWITFQYKGKVYATNEYGSIPKPINIHKAGIEKIIGCRVEKGIRSINRVDDGYLVGFDCGEFGGSLCLFSKKGAYLYEIFNQPVTETVWRNGRFYGICDLDYPASFNSNSIIEIKKQNNKWVVEKYLDLPSIACGIDTDKKGNFIVVTMKNLIKINKNKSIDTLINDGFWQGSIHGNLYVTSVTVKDEIAYIGMTSGVLKYHLDNGVQTWLVRDKSTAKTGLAKKRL